MSMKSIWCRVLYGITNYVFKIGGDPERLELPLQKIEKLIRSGAAFAALDDDLQIKEKYGVTGSPTLILNEGRQKIYGNVGYRVIEANVQELLNQPESQASWC